MANKKIQATATLFLDTKDAQNDAKKFVSDLKQKLSEIETAADKMSVFKDMVAYIAQVDRALAALRAKNGAAFNSMFDGLDVNLKKQFEDLFGIDGGKLGQLDVLREKLNTLTPESSMKEIKRIADAIKDLYASIGKEAPTLEFLDGHSKAAKTEYIKQLTDEVNNFAVVWKDVNATVSKGFGLGGSGSSGPSEEIQQQIDKLKKQKEEYQEIIDAFSGKNIKVKTTKKTDVAQLQELINKFNEAQAAVQQFETAGNTSGEGYKKAVAEAFKMATLLKNTMDYVAEYGSDEGNLFVSSNVGKNDPYSLAEKYIKDLKKTNIFNDVQTYLNQQIQEIDTQVNKLQNPTENILSLYDELTQKVREYLELRKQINATDRDKDPKEYKRLIDRKNEVALEIEELKELDDDGTDALYDIFEEADADGAKLNEIVAKFCNVLQIEIPQAATTVSSATGSAFAKITQDANEASEAVQNVMYHLGNLLNGQGKPRDTFGDMTENLTSAAVGTRWEQYGFGTLGGGLFGVSDPSTITQNPGKSTFIQSIDLSKYNMYMANTEERATALIDFLSKLQKFSMKSAEPNYAGFDSQLQGIDADSLYDQAKLIFDQSQLTKDQFEAFIDEMVTMLKQAGLAFDAQTGELSFTNLTKEIANSENISTRFMKMLGYHGINVGGTSFDGLGQGSVLFDFNKLDIVGYFNTIQEAVEDYQKIINQIDGGNWVGSIEQLQQYANNIDRIINKITDAKNAGKLLGDPGVDETLSKLTQIRQNIGDVLLGKGINGNNPFITITTGSAEAGKAIDQAKAKVESFLALNDKVQHENVYGSAEDNVEIGKYIERLEVGKAELEALGAQGLITAEDLEKVNQAFEKSKSYLEGEISHYDSFYSGSSWDYYDDYKEQERRADEADGENSRLQRQLDIMQQISEIDKQIGLTYDYQVDALDGLIEQRRRLLDDAENANSLDEQTLQTQRAITAAFEERSKFIHDDYDKAFYDFYDELDSLRHENIGDMSLENIDEHIDRLSSLYAKLQEANNNYLLGDDLFGSAQEFYTDAISSLNDAKSRFALQEDQRRVEEAESDALRSQEAANRLLDEKFELQKENEQLKLQLATQQSSSDTRLDDDELSDIQKENGALQDKLGLLQEIADIYGSDITQRDRNSYDKLSTKEMDEGLTSKEEDRFFDLSEKVNDADASLEEFGNTYDKIILKLSNGKSVEIFPDDAGLRALNKFANEGYGETYNGYDIDDVVFVRKQEQSVVEQTNQELQEQLNLQKQIGDEIKKDAQLEPADKGSVVATVSKDIVDSQEVSQLEALQQKLLEVKSAVDAKTQAFEAEFVTVNNVVDSEIMSLQSLIGQLQEVLAQINLINDGFNNINTNAPKIELKSVPVEPSDVSTENTHYVTDPQGRPVNAYRGIEGAYSGLVSNRYHGGTFWTTNIELAKEYAGAIGKVEKSLLSMKNPMEIDGHGAYWNQIEYIGDNSDEASKKLHELNSTIKQTESMLEHLKTIKPTEQELKNLERGFISETQNEREIREYTAALEKAKAERDAIFADSSNPYGKKNTNELVEIAKSKGYDGVIFKDIIDSAAGDVTDLSTVMVTFEQDQIHYIETISSTFESAIASLKGQFGDLTQHISASSDEVEASIRKMAELKGKVKSGEISEDEYDAFIAQNAIARDYDQLAKKARAVPDFITGALDGNDFELKHVIERINGMLDNMRNRAQNIAKAFGKEGMSFDQLLTDNVNVAPVAESVDGDVSVAGEVEQLDKLQAALVEVKNAIAAKTKAFVDEGNVVGQTVGKEISALMKLSEIVDSIVPKVSALVDGLKSLKDHGVNIKDQDISKTGSDDNQTTGDTKDAPPTDPFKNALRNQKNSFNEYRDSLKNVDYLTDSLRAELDALGVSLRQVGDQPGLDAWIDSFNVLKGSVKDVQSEFEQMNIGKINLYQKELNNTFNKLTLPQKEELFEEYSKAIILLNQQKQAVKDGHAVELASIKQITAALQEKIDAQIQANKVAKDAEKTQKKNSNFGSTASINAAAKYNSLTRMANSDQFASSSTVAAALAQYEQAYRRMIKMRDDLRNSAAIDDDDREAFKAATTECNNYAKALDKIVQNSLKLKGNKANSDDYMLGSDFDYSDIESRKAALADFAKQMYGVDVAATDFKDNWNKAVFAVDNGDGTFTQMTATFTDARNEIVAMAGDTKKAQGALANFWDELKGKFKSIGAYLIASVSFYEVWGVIKQGVNYVREIDSALTELKKVTNETDASYDQFLQDMSKTGSVIGATVADLTTMASEWARLGYSMEEAGKLAESTAILLNVSEFDDATEASQALISTMQAFQYTADESGHVVDILNEVGNNYAVSSDGIATALQDSASALMEGGNNLEQAVALVAAANRVVQDPNSVGSALRTISLRLRGTSVEVLEEIGEETDGVVESTSKLQEKIKALSGVNILTDAGEYKDTYTILKEIGNVWEDMSDIDQAALLELMAGEILARCA